MTIIVFYGNIQFQVSSLLVRKSPSQRPFFFFNKNPRHSLRVFYSICSLQATQCGEVVKEVTQLSCSNHPVCSISRKVHSLLNRCFVQCQAYISEFFLSKNLYYYWPQCGSSILVLVCYYMIQ